MRVARRHYIGDIQGYPMLCHLSDRYDGADLNAFRKTSHSIINPQAQVISRHSDQFPHSPFTIYPKPNLIIPRPVQQYKIRRARTVCTLTYGFQWEGHPTMVGPFRSTSVSISIVPNQTNPKSSDRWWLAPSRRCYAEQQE